MKLTPRFGSKLIRSVTPCLSSGNMTYAGHPLRCLVENGSIFRWITPCSTSSSARQPHISAEKLEPTNVETEVPFVHLTAPTIPIIPFHWNRLLHWSLRYPIPQHRSISFQAKQIRTPAPNRRFQASNPLLGHDRLAPSSYAQADRSHN